MVDAQKVGIATLVLVGSVAGFTASGVLNAFSDGYFLGRARKKGVTYKTIAKRNAILGGAIGALGATMVLVGEQKKAEKVNGMRFRGY